jgi:plasmid rolling circle replication initiator protein Rep
MCNLYNKHLHNMLYVVKNKSKFNIPSPQVSARRGHYQWEKNFKSLGRDVIKMQPKVFTHI